MDFGTVAHKLLLGRGKDVVMVGFDDWRKKEAQELRAKAEAAGKIAVLEKDFAKAEDMVRAARQQLALCDDCADAFKHPELSEQVLVWKEEWDVDQNVWLRCMTDYIAPRRQTGHIVVYDYKTTGMSASPAHVSRHMYNMEYEVQAAFNERGLHHLIGDAAGLVVFRFVVQETAPPYSLTVVELDSAGLTIGRKKVASAIALWWRCQRDNVWPGYPRRIINAEMPAYLENSWLEREMNDDDIVASSDTNSDPFLNASPWVPDVKPRESIDNLAAG
jgi:hypothetical protein